MGNKISRYFIYGIRFINSSDKRRVIKELLSEIKKKGILTGIKSILHKKSDYYYGEDGGPEAFDNSKLSIKDYDKKLKIVLPKVVNPKVSIIIPTYNEVVYTYNCIHSIFENNDFKDYEIIVADDKSAEDTAILWDNFENLVIIRNENNLGFLRNCNHAATKARGEYIVFLNNDTQVQKDWLKELLYIFEHNDKAGLVGSKLVYPDGSLQEAGGVIWRDGSAHNYGNTGNPGACQYNYVKEADYISGASIMIRKALWQQLGGFDELYLPAYGEDSDLCFRVREQGYKVIYQPFSVVVHFEGVSHGTDVGQGVKQHQVTNQKKFFERWQNELKPKSKQWENIFAERDRTTTKEHVLVIDHYLPQIDKDAGSRTISNFIDVLLDLGYSVKFLGENSNAGIPYQKQFQLKGVEVLYGNQFNFASRNWKHYLKANLRNFDAILLSRSSVCTPIMTFLRKQHYNGNIIYYGHDLGFLRVEREAGAANDAALMKQAKALKAKEDYMYRNANNSLVCSMDELGYLQSYISKPLHYVPPYYFDVTQGALPYEQRAGIMFVGGFNHPPNQEAMRWFLEEAYEPLAGQGIPLTIAGSKMPEFIVQYKERFPSLTILPDATVDELNALYATTRIAIVPLRSGAGVKGKVIEAMAKGVPVVGTETAFEGMPKDSGFIYKGVNSSADMIKEIERVYTNKDSWEELAGYGKHYILHNFNKANMKQVFSNIIESSATQLKQKV